MKNEGTCFAVKKGRNLPLGISYQNNSFGFAVSVPEASSCKLLISKKGNAVPEAELPMESVGQGIFSLCVRVPKRLGRTGYEYLYEAGGKKFCDPYATQLSGRKVFGEAGGELRSEVYVPEFNVSAYERHTAEDSILYKLHVRGFTRAANSGVKKKGTYAGLTEKIPYLKELGITGVLLLPVTEFNEREEAEKPAFLQVIGAPKRAYSGQKAADKKMKPAEAEVAATLSPEVRLNYWGYTKTAFYFAPKASYASNPAKAPEEFHAMVEKLHEAGIDVYLEMMFDGSTSLTAMLESLRFWVRTYGVDGFHINSRTLPTELVASDPYLKKTAFLTDEINDKVKNAAPGRFFEYRDSFAADMRRYLKGDEGLVQTLCHYMKNRRPGVTRVHYLTDHNGFTLADLYAYDVRHNEANGEKGNDGTEFNFSWNCGEEGATKKQKVLSLRKRMYRNAMVTMLLAQGTPMLLGGDEFLRTKQGNNNSYCQDNEISWVDWSLYKKNREFFEFTKELIAFRKEHPMFTLERELRETDFISCGWPEFSMHGLSPWQVDFSAYNRLAAMMYCGDYIRKNDRTFEDHFYLIYNMHWEKHEFEVPELTERCWKVVFDTAGKNTEFAECLMLEPRSVVLLRAAKDDGKKIPEGTEKSIREKRKRK